MTGASVPTVSPRHSALHRDVPIRGMGLTRRGSDDDLSYLMSFTLISASTTLMLLSASPTAMLLLW
jgi:hypothetical protein